MCHTGKCKYELQDGECSVSTNIPFDAACVKHDYEITMCYAFRKMRIGKKLSVSKNRLLLLGIAEDPNEGDIFIQGKIKGKWEFLQLQGDLRVVTSIKSFMQKVSEVNGGDLKLVSVNRGVFVFENFPEWQYRFLRNIGEGKYEIVEDDFGEGFILCPNCGEKLEGFTNLSYFGMYSVRCNNSGCNFGEVDFNLRDDAIKKFGNSEHKDFYEIPFPPKVVKC